MKAAVAALLAIVVAIPALGFATGRLPIAHAASAAPCMNSQLLIRPVRSDAGLGHVGEMYSVHNLFGGTCTLYGYPGAELLDGQFRSLPTTVQRGVGYLTGRKYEHLVTIGNGHDGYFVVEWVHIPSPGQSCPHARYLMVTPPGDRLPVVTYAAGTSGFIDACGGILHVTPVEPNPLPF